MNNLTKVKRQATVSRIASIKDELETTFSYGPHEIGLKNKLYDLQQELEDIDHAEEKRLQGVS